MSFRNLAPALLVALALVPDTATASDAPHDSTNLTNGCNDCHIAHGAPGATLTKQSGNANLCLTCHTTKTPTYINSWTASDQAVPGTGGSSHNWSSSATNATYGAAPPTNSTLALGMKAASPGNLSCSACHDQHAQTAAPVDPLAPATAGTAGRHFQQITNTSNEMCLDCHRSWKVTSVVNGTYTGSNLSHPVTIALPAAGATFRAPAADTAFMGTATGGTTTTLTLDGTKYKWASNALASYVVRFTSGANKNVVTVVTANSTTTTSPYTTTLTFNAVGAAVAAGTTFELARVSAQGSDVTTAAGTTTTLVDSTKTWVASTNAASVTMLSGTSANLGKTVAISSMSGSSITLSAALPAATAANDVYRINWKTDAVGSATAAGTATTLTDSTKAWTASALVNLTVRFTSGANAGASAKITANTASGLTFGAVANAVAAGDGYEIYPAQATPLAGTVTTSTTTTVAGTFTAGALQGQMIRFTSGTYAGYVSTIASNTATAITFTAMPAAPAAGTTYEIDWDGNTSNNVVLGGTTPGYTTGNIVCSSCHGVHFADGDSSTYDGKPQASSGAGAGMLLRRENDDRACTGCHVLKTHNSANTGSSRPAWGQSFGCRTCHQPHQTPNIYLFVPTLATPNSGNVAVTFQHFTTGEEAGGLVNGTGTPSAGNGPCEACHTDTRNGAQVTGATSTFTAASTAVTLSSTTGLAAGWEVKRTADGPSAWTRIASVGSGTSVTLITGGYRGTTGTGTWQAANPRFRGISAGRGNTGSGAGAVGTEHPTTSKCTDCHSHSTGFTPGGESNGGSACGGCHSKIFGPMNATVTTNPGGATIVTRHTLGTDSVLNVSPTDSGITWGSPLNANAAAARSCVNMCHGDHPHNVSPSTTHEYNGYLDATSSTSRGNGAPTASNRDKTDFEGGSTNFGMCVSCHRNPVDASNPVQHPAINGTAYGSSAHNYTSNTVSGTTYSWTFTLHDGSTFQRNCTKCHSDRGDGQPNASATSSAAGAVHYSAYPSLLSGATNGGKGLVTGDLVCYNCHGNGTTGQNRSGKNVANNTTATFSHPVGNDTVHATPAENAATSGTLFSGTNRHANCLDCHDTHKAQPVASGVYAGTIGTYTATTTSGQADTLSDSNTSKGWTKNQFKGWTLRMVSGAQAGKSSAIYGSGTTVGYQLLVKLAAAPAAGDQYVIVSNGWRVAPGSMPKASPTMSGAWGVQPTFNTPPSPPAWNDSSGCGSATAANSCEVIATTYAAAPTYTKTSVDPPAEAYVCLKCHSSFAYGATLPNSPSGAPTSSSSTWSNSIGLAMRESDLAGDTNPGNLAHHAIFGRGNNQPMISSATTNSYLNPNWPKYTSGTVTASSTTVTLSTGTWPLGLVPGWFIYVGSSTPTDGKNGGSPGWYEVTAVSSDTTLTIDRACAAPSTCSAAANYLLTPGLGAAFVPPFGPWSQLECTDCHRSGTASDPLGPHGSANKWLLRSAEAKTFIAEQSSTSGAATITNTPTDANNLCLNCHRRDVYGDFNFEATPSSVTAGAVYTFSRQNHTPDNANGSSSTYRSKWGISCMNCHGGARQGAIHGGNYGKGGSGASYSGKRFLAGSSWYAVTRSSSTTAGQCWTKGSTGDAVDTCGHAHSGSNFQSGAANYDYQSTQGTGGVP